LDRVVLELVETLIQVLVIMVHQLSVLLLLVLVVVEEVVRLLELWLQILEEVVAVVDKDFLVILEGMQHQGKEILEDLEVHHLEVMLAAAAVALEVLVTVLLVLVVVEEVEMGYLLAFLEHQQLMQVVVAAAGLEHRVVEDLEEEDLEDHLDLVMELQEL